MKKLSTILLALLVIATAKANDGAFYANGNHLIPITETTISVKKEILTITRVTDTVSKWGCMFKVHVYYEFFNPGPAKDLLVGFESPMPDGNGFSGTLDEAFAGQPYVYDFNVVMNGNKLPFQFAHVPYTYEGDYQFDYTTKTEDYYKDGRVVDMSKEQYRKTMEGIFKGEEGEDYLDWLGYTFYYVYHFNAHFNEGLNTIEHTYTVKGADVVMMDYLFDYILTAANRWANNGIDDFTLILNMGEHQSFSVEPTFFETPDVSFTVKGRVGDRNDMIGMCENCPLFHVQSGNLVFSKKNFHPEGELHIMSDALYLYMYDFEKADKDEMESFVNSFKKQYYNLYVDDEMPIDFSNLPSEQKRIIKNVPFAYRGYVFKDKGLQRFFVSTEWYVPNPDYQADMTKLDKNEKEWVLLWSK